LAARFSSKPKRVTVRIRLELRGETHRVGEKSEAKEMKGMDLEPWQEKMRRCLKLR